MSKAKIRRKVAYEAARLIYNQEETGYYQSKQKAARRIHGKAMRPGHLPGDGEIRKQIQAVIEVAEAQKNGHPDSLKNIFSEDIEFRQSNRPVPRIRTASIALGKRQGRSQNASRGRCAIS